MATRGFLDGAVYLARRAQPYIPAALGHAFGRAWSSIPQLNLFYRDRASSLPQKPSWIDHWLENLKVQEPFDQWIQDPLNQQGVKGVINENLAEALANFTKCNYDRVQAVYECDRARPGQTVRFVLRQGLEQDFVYNLHTLCDMRVPRSVQLELMKLGTQVLTTSISAAATYLITLFKDQRNPGDYLDVRTVSFIGITRDSEGVWKLVIRVNLVVSKRLKQDKPIESPAQYAEGMAERFLRLHVNYHFTSIGASKESSLEKGASAEAEPTLSWDLKKAGPVSVIAHICRLEDSSSSGALLGVQKKRLCIEQSIRC